MKRAVTLPGTLLLLATVLLLDGTALAATRTVTLQQVLELSFAGNGELTALRNDTEAARAALMGAGLPPNPTLELEGASGSLSGNPHESSITVGLSQEFVTAGKGRWRRQAAEAEAEAVNWRIADRKRLLALEVKKAYFDLLLAHKRLELADRGLALSSRLLAVTRELVAAGDIPEMDVNLAMIEAARSEGRKLVALRDIIAARALLLSLAGMVPGTDLVPSAPTEAAPVSLSPEEAEQLALTNRPDLRALQAAMATAAADVELARAERTPNLTAGLFYSHERSMDATGTDEEQSRDDLLGVRLSLSIPIFDRNQAGLQQARARQGRADAVLVSARNTIAHEVRTELAGLSSAEQALGIYSRDILPQLDEHLKLVLEAFGLGEIGTLAVIEEQRQYLELHDGHLEATHGRQTAHARLEAAIGKDLDPSTSGGVQ